MNRWALVGKHFGEGAGGDSGHGFDFGMVLEKLGSLEKVEGNVLSALVLEEGEACEVWAIVVGGVWQAEKGRGLRRWHGEAACAGVWEVEGGGVGRMQVSMMLGMRM